MNDGASGASATLARAERLGHARNTGMSRALE